MNLSKFFSILPGLIFCICISLSASFLAKSLPQIGSISLSLLIGVFLGNFFNPPVILLEGIGFSLKRLLEAAIILLGFSLSYRDLSIINFYTVFTLCTMIGLTLFLSLYLGKLLGLPKELSLLMGMGNAICGSAAIMATSKVIEAPKKDMASAITMTNILGITSLFILPFLLKGFDAQKSGFLIGGSLQAMGHVIASVSLLDHTTAHYAVAIKMTRIFMLTPIIFFLTLIKGQEEDGKNLPRIPYYMIGFLACIFIANIGLVEPELISLVNTVQHKILAVAMAALGLSLKFSQVFHRIRLNLLLGAGVFVLQFLFLLLASKFT